jgi:hypothetical protein
MSEHRKRIERIFEELSDQGIIGLADFECCNSCAGYRLGNEKVSAWTKEHGEPPVGYVFFHEQATDAANEGLSLWLAHGAVDELNDETDARDNQVRVAEAVVEAFQARGYTVHWEGNVDRKIQVEEPRGGWNLDYDRDHDEDEDEESWDDGYDDGDDEDEDE